MKVLGAFFSVALACSTAFAAKSEVLRLGTFDHVTQYKTTQEIQEYVADALKKENIQIIYIPTPILRGASLVQSGAIDGEMPSSKISLRYSHDNIIFLKNPLFFSNLKVIYLRANIKYSFENLPKLQGAVILNNVFMKDLANKKSLQIIEVAGIDLAFKSLEKKRVDYIIISEDIAKNFLQENPQSEKLFVIDSHVVEEIPFYLSLNSGKSSLIPRIEKALREASRADLQKYPHIKNMINKNF
jgi:ABC-type amino acid transport substrate-binding protein